MLEPYYGGSHRAVLDCLLPALGWEHDLLTLPARKWKWRMRGSAVTMADEAARLHADWIRRWPAGEQGREGAHSRWDAVFASTFVDLAGFLGLAGDAVRGVPTVVYFHENQLMYPNRHAAEWDLQFPLTNITSALAADECWFNTAWNMEGFIGAIAPFLRQFPDHLPRNVEDRIAARSSVLHPPIDPVPFDGAAVERGDRCRVVWPHRWEHDKDPETFLGVVGGLAAEGLDFEVALAGQDFAETRQIVASAASSLGDRLVHLGNPTDRVAYARLLASCDVAVSTAVNEFFGLAMLEAAYCGCYTVVPDRLAYPELYPHEMRYADAGSLAARLRRLITERPVPGQGRMLAQRFTIGALLPSYVAAFDRLFSGS